MNVERDQTIKETFDLALQNHKKNNFQLAEKLYKDVYESEEWVNDIGPKVANLIDRNSIKIHNLTSTELSIMK